MKSLENVLEREYQLCKRIPGFHINGLRDSSVKILDWYFNRLIRDIQDEQEETELEDDGQ